MSMMKEEPEEIAVEEQAWSAELERVGFVRRILISRRWYGADWWFVAIASVMVAVFIIIAIAPQLFAPYAPDALVGSRFLAPGQHPAVPVLIVPKDSPVKDLKGLAVAPKVLWISYSS